MLIYRKQTFNPKMKIIDSPSCGFRPVWPSIFCKMRQIGRRHFQSPFTFIRFSFFSIKWMVTEMVTLPNVVFFVLLKKDIHVGKSEKFDFGVNYPFKYFPLPVCTRKWQVLQHVKTHMSSVSKMTGMSHWVDYSMRKWGCKASLLFSKTD